MTASPRWGSKVFELLEGGAAAAEGRKEKAQCLCDRGNAWRYLWLPLILDAAVSIFNHRCDPADFVHGQRFAVELRHLSGDFAPTQNGDGQFASTIDKPAGKDEKRRDLDRLLECLRNPIA